MDYFRIESDPRLWWYPRFYPTHEPPAYAMLADDDMAMLHAWCDEVREKKLIGETGPPLVSIVGAFLMTTRLRNVVQCGHYAGFSTLILGCMMRQMNQQNSLFTVDIDPQITAFTQKWVTKAGLDPYVKVYCNDSASPQTADAARAYFGGEPCVVLIDSSHMYEHTLKELDLWYEKLAPGGMMFLHDVSDFAAQWDSTRQGGVRRALNEWLERNPVECIRINDVAPMNSDPVYADGCGLGILQKPHSVRTDSLGEFQKQTQLLRQLWIAHDQPPFASLSGSLELLILGANFHAIDDPRGKSKEFYSGQRVACQIAVYAPKPMDTLVAGCVVKGPMGQDLLENNTLRSSGQTFALRTTGIHTIEIEMDWSVDVPGRHPITLELSRGNSPDTQQTLCVATHMMYTHTVPAEHTHTVERPVFQLEHVRPLTK